MNIPVVKHEIIVKADSILMENEKVKEKIKQFKKVVDKCVKAGLCWHCGEPLITFASNMINSYDTITQCKSLGTRESDIIDYVSLVNENKYPAIHYSVTNEPYYDYDCD